MIKSSPGDRLQKPSRFTEGERDNKTIQNLIAVSIILLVFVVDITQSGQYAGVSAMILDLLGA